MALPTRRSPPLVGSFPSGLTGDGTEVRREAAALALPTHYPCTAICKTCWRPIRTERWLLADWYHTEPEPES
jgi:hypothetical protein